MNPPSQGFTGSWKGNWFLGGVSYGQDYDSYLNARNGGGRSIGPAPNQPPNVVKPPESAQPFNPIASPIPQIPRDSAWVNLAGFPSPTPGFPVSANAAEAGSGPRPILVATPTQQPANAIPVIATQLAGSTPAAQAMSGTGVNADYRQTTSNEGTPPNVIYAFIAALIVLVFLLRK